MNKSKFEQLWECTVFKKTELCSPTNTMWCCLLDIGHGIVKNKTLYPQFKGTYKVDLFKGGR